MDARTEDELLDRLWQYLNDATVDLSHITIAPHSSPRFLSRSLAILTRHDDDRLLLTLNVSHCPVLGQNVLPLIPFLLPQRLHRHHHHHHSTLRELRLTHNGLNDVTAIVLAHSLMGGTIHLMVLDLSHNGIGNSGAAAFGGPNNTIQIQHLRMNDNVIGDTGAMALAENRHLERLHLADNQIATAGGQALIQTLLRGSTSVVEPPLLPNADNNEDMTTTRLHFLDLYGNQIVVDDVLPVMEQFLRQHERIHNVDVILARNTTATTAPWITTERFGQIRTFLNFRQLGRLDSFISVTVVNDNDNEEQQLPPPVL